MLDIMAVTKLEVVAGTPVGAAEVMAERYPGPTALLATGCSSTAGELAVLARRAGGTAVPTAATSAVGGVPRGGGGWGNM